MDEWDWMSQYHAQAIISGACAYIFNMIGDELSARMQEQIFQEHIVLARNDLMYQEAANAG